jgi:predicted nucleic acid-binding protein
MPQSPTVGPCLPAQQSAEEDPYRRIDRLLPAIALQHNLTIVSRNVSDFANTEALILNPWEQ